MKVKEVIAKSSERLFLGGDRWLNLKKLVSSVRTINKRRAPVAPALFAERYQARGIRGIKGVLLCKQIEYPLY